MWMKTHRFSCEIRSDVPRGGQGESLSPDREGTKPPQRGVWIAKRDCEMCGLTMPGDGCPLGRKVPPEYRDREPPPPPPPQPRSGGPQSGRQFRPNGGRAEILRHISDGWGCPR